MNALRRCYYFLIHHFFEIVTIIFFLLAFMKFAFGQVPEPSIAQYVKSEVEREQKIDSSDAANLFLVPFKSEIFAIAQADSLPPALLAAFIQEESNFNQWATRTEPLYKRKKIVIREARKWSKLHGGIPTFYTELDDRSRSYGLMQPMGQLAREQGFSSRYMSELFLPFNSISQGAIKLRTLLKKYRRDTLSVISSYNQGNPRKHKGVFVNARYVYRIAVAWHQYEILFKNYNDNKTNFDSALNRAHYRIPERKGIEALPWKLGDGFGPSFKFANIIGARSARFGKDRRSDSAAYVFRQSNRQPPVPESGDPVTASGFNTILLCGFAASMFGFCWMVLRGFRADRAGYPFRLPRSVDKRVRARIEAEFKKDRDARALYRPRLGHLPAGFYNHIPN